MNSSALIATKKMLPVLASYFRFDNAFVERAGRMEGLRNRLMAGLGVHIANPRNAALVVIGCTVLFGVAPGVVTHFTDVSLVALD